MTQTAPVRAVARATPRPESRKAPRGLRLGGAVADKLFLLPIAAVLVVLFLIPVARSAWWSITDFNGLDNEYNVVGLENYTRVFSDSSMVAGFTFTLLYTFATTLVITCLAIPLALVLNRKFIGRNVVRAAFFFPAIPSIAVLGLVWGFIRSPLGGGVMYGGSSCPPSAGASSTAPSRLSAAARCPGCPHPDWHVSR
jgi:raffinose/stachyose/melibiose transport system permease protein